MVGSKDKKIKIRTSLSDLEGKVPFSCVPTIQWPAIPEPRAAQALAIQYQLSQSQWWEPRFLLKWQLQQLNIVIQHAYQNTAFYKEHYQDLRIKKCLTFDFLQSLPTVARADIQNSPIGLKSESIPPEHGKIAKISTSGSTGRSVEIYKTEMCNFMIRAFTLRDHDWHNRMILQDFSTIRHSPEKHYQAPNGYEQTTWGSSSAGIYKTGYSFRLDSMTPVSKQLEWLLENSPDYLMTYPSNLRALIDYSIQTDKVPSSLKQVITFGELLPITLREYLKQSWNIKLTDMYSCQEAGTLALQCPNHDHYHVQSENVLLEVLDENGNPCAPGTIGKVVISSLHNFASPLIRYELGDYAEVGEPCDCGRGLAVLKRIYGRTRNMITYPDGSQSWPFLGSANYYKDVAPINQFQVIQTHLDQLEFHMAVDQQLSEHQQSKLIKKLQHTLRYPFQVSFHYHDEIKRSEGGKYEDFVSKL